MLPVTTFPLIIVWDFKSSYKTQNSGHSFMNKDVNIP